jgi:hypothetical protein
MVYMAPDAYSIIQNSQLLGVLHTTAMGSREPRTNFSREDKVEVHQNI